MSLLSVPEAAHFCGSFGGTGVAAISSFRDWGERQKRSATFTEGTQDHRLFRDMVLREVERLLFLSAALYRRSFDLQIASTSSWVHVTQYYGAFYAAQALLGMFGAPTLGKRAQMIVEPRDGTIGAQEFAVASNPATGRGSHQNVWSHFYRVMASLVMWVEPSSRFALQPISSDPYWLSRERNAVTYDSAKAIELTAEYQRQFRASRFRKSLPGALGVQMDVFEELLRLAMAFAREFNVATDGLAMLSPGGSRKLKIERLVRDPRVWRYGRFVKARCLS